MILIVRSKRHVKARSALTPSRTKAAPKNPIILAHGLFGFDELHIAGPGLPGLHYWRGISDALAAKGVEVITATVPPSGSIEARAARLGESIASKAKGKSVNIIA